MWRGSGTAFDMEMDRMMLMSARKPSRRQRTKRQKILVEFGATPIAHKPAGMYNGHPIRVQRGGAHPRITSRPSKE